ncbi:MAG: hypothetical protein QNK23_05420 [Crocinitomicaceae bacterium]|nr:hypothetical protein [Crocinitomicaceae bacterium]
MKNIFGLLVLTAMFLSSCNKEGCTDAGALNYNSEAKVDDGSCTYQTFTTDVNFWLSTGWSTYFISNSITEFRIYIDNEYVGSLDVNDDSPGIPECYTGGFTNNFNIGTVEGVNVPYRVNQVNSSGDETVLLAGSVNMYDNTCLHIEILD